VRLLFVTFILCFLLSAHANLTINMQLYTLQMQPLAQDRRLVVFCDEINLPSYDAYQTQPVVAFMRQLAEHGGFWRASDNAFVRVENVQFVGACNPPTDAGRQVGSTFDVLSLAFVATFFYVQCSNVCVSLSMCYRLEIVCRRSAHVHAIRFI
jgi:hypothetical protein